MDEFILQANGLAKTYRSKTGAVEVVTEASITIQKGEFVMIVGPSGSGKSTLLYMLSGLRQPSRGQVWVGKKAYASMKANEMSRLRHESYGFVMQQHLLVPYLNCVENVCLARASNLEKRAETMLAELGLAEHFHKLPSELSFGERQRVALARGLIHNPQVLFADEPTASVNTELADMITDYIASYCRDGGSCVMVTHDLNLLSKATRVFTMRDGRLIQGVPSP